MLTVGNCYNVTCGLVSFESKVQAMKLSIFCAKVVLLSCARCSAYARNAAPAPRDVLPPRRARTRPAADKKKKTF